MALNKYKLGDLIKLSEEKNSDGIYTEKDVKGISNQKEFIETKADLNGVSLNPYLVVKPDFFAYVTITSRNGNKISLAFNNTINTYIVSSSYIVFKIERKDLLVPEFLFMFFKSPEFDRYARYNSWGSAREAFSWDEMCDIVLELPSIEIQQKYVDIYNAMLQNQKVYESRLDDLKLVCDGYIEDLRKKMPCEEIGKYIEDTCTKNTDLKAKIVGISNKQKLIASESRTAGVDKTKYYILKEREFAYSPIHINDGSIAFNDSKKQYIVSPIYRTFKIKDETKLYSKYLMMWFARTEFARYCAFHAFGSARDNFDWEQMCKVSIPIPDITVQKSIAKIFKVLEERKEINEKLKNQIKDICPILIQGALKEGREEKTE